MALGAGRIRRECGDVRGIGGDRPQLGGARDSMGGRQGAGEGEGKRRWWGFYTGVARVGEFFPWCWSSRACACEFALHSFVPSCSVMSRKLGRLICGFKKTGSA